MKKYKISELLNVLTRTLRRWDEDGLLKVYRTPTGDRFYTEEQYKTYMGIPMENQVCNEDNNSSKSKKVIRYVKSI